MTEQIVANIRVVEDTLWLFAFVALLIVGVRYASAAFGSVRTGYLTLVLAAISGIIWKGLSLFSRVTGIKEPEVLFELVKESFEALFGFIFIIGCVLLVKGLSAIYKES